MPLNRQPLLVVGVTVVGLAATGCGDSESGAISAATRIERCVERFLERGRPVASADEPAVRRYVENTYCERFERSGWVDDDGVLSIGAQEWLDRSGSEECATAVPGQPARPVPCEELRPPGAARVIDCALLHLVRRAEVETYLRTLSEADDVACDDGTPLDELGVP